jgi:hypothetical protein
LNKTLKTYSITGKLELIVSVDIRAEGMAEALESSKKLTEHDFVDIPGEYFDGGLTIIGISDNPGYELEKDKRK